MPRRHAMADSEGCRGPLRPTRTCPTRQSGPRPPNEAGGNNHTARPVPAGAEGSMKCVLLLRAPPGKAGITKPRIHAVTLSSVQHSAQNHPAHSMPNIVLRVYAAVCTEYVCEQWRRRLRLRGLGVLQRRYHCWGGRDHGLILD